MLDESINAETDAALRQVNFVERKLASTKRAIYNLDHERQLLEDKLRRMDDEEYELQQKKWEMWRELSETWEIYRQARVRRLSPAMYAALPRELRDTIYSLCLDHSWELDVVKESLKGLYGYIHGDLSDYEDLLQYELLNPAIVGKEVSCEVAELIYTRAELPCFGTKAGESRRPQITHFKDFLTRDFFRTGTLPAGHIRRLDLILQKSLLSEKRKSDLEAVSEGLMACRNNRNLDIHISFDWHSSLIDVFHFLSFLKPAYQAMASRRITFDLIYERNIWAAKHKHEVTSLNLAHMFELPEGIWKHHLMALCESVGEIALREQKWIESFPLETDAEIQSDGKEDHLNGKGPQQQKARLMEP